MTVGEVPANRARTGAAGAANYVSAAVDAAVGVTVGGWDAVGRPPRRPGPRPMPGDIAPDAPPEAPEPKEIPLLRLLLPVVMLVAVVGMVAVMVVSGAGRNPVTFMFPLLMVMSTVGMLAGGGGGGRDVGPARRDYQRHLASIRRAIADAVARQRAHLLHDHPDPGDAWTLAGTDRMWERHRDDGDFGAARIGLGPQRPATAVTPPRVTAPEKLDPVSAVALRQVVRAGRVVPGLPVAVDVTAFPLLAVGGSAAGARRLLRAMVAQLAVTHHPADLAIAFVGVAPDWEWLKWLPHHCHPSLADDAGHLRLRAATWEELAPVLRDLPGEPAVAVIVDGAEIGAADVGTQGVSALAVAGDDGALAELAVARGLALTVTDGRVWATTASGEEDLAEADGLGAAAAEVLARRLAAVPVTSAADDRQRRRDPVLAELGLDPPPATIDFRPRHGADRLRIPIGTRADGGVLHLDLKESAEGGVGPHGLCIGATGSGKSELLKSIVLALATTHGPDQLNFVLVDFKGGATFLGLEELPHVSAVITNLADELVLVDRMQDAIHGEMTRRQELLRRAGNFPGVAEYEEARRAGRTDLKPLPALLIVVDEFSELLGSRPEFADLFVAVGRLGRSLHMHLLLASQRLEEGRLRGLDSHLSYRIGLKTFSAAESRSVLGVPDAHHLPAQPGAGYLKTDSGAPLRFQAAYVSGPAPVADAVGAFGRGATRRARVAVFTAGRSGAIVGEGAPAGPSPAHLPVVASAGSAPATLAEPGVAAEPKAPAVSRPTTLDAAVTAMAGHRRSAHRVWLPPLPARTPLADVADSATGPLRAVVGLVDKPALQRQDPYLLDLSGTGGHVAVVGAPRSGKTTAARTLVASLALTTPAAALHVHAIDFGAGGLADVSALPHVASVAHRGDVEKLHRVVSAVAGEVARREELYRERGWHSPTAARSAGVPDVLLLIDGWPALRQEHLDLADRVQTVLADGLSVGVHVALTAHRWTELRPAVRDLIGTRVELRQAEAIDSVVDRKAAKLVPESPGRGLAPDGCAVLIADTGQAEIRDVAAACRDRGDEPAPKLQLLPREIGWAEVGAAGGPAAVGLDEENLAPVHFDPQRERHLMVFGSAGSGRTTTLRTMAALLMATRPRLKFLVIDYRRGLMELVPQDRLAGYAGSAAVAAPMVAELAEALRSRLPGPDITPAQLRARDWWEGPDIAILVDDYDLVAGARGNPLAPLAEFIPHAADIGVHVIVGRRIGGALRALHDPVLGAVKDQGATALILDGTRDDGPLLGVKPMQRPPGRGSWVVHGRRPRVVQVAAPPGTFDAGDASGSGAARDADGARPLGETKEPTGE